MKTLFTFFATVFLITTLHAKVVYLNNMVESNSDENLYSTFSEAYNACTTPGDTIYVVGSNNNYGSISISKQITLIGPGYFLVLNPGTQVNKKTALFNNITLETGSEGSVIKSISNAAYTYSVMFIKTDDITIESCYIYNYINIAGNNNANIKNVTIKKCYFVSYGTNITTYSYYKGIWLNFTITNNICNAGLFAPPGSTGIVSNNLFKRGFKPNETSSFEIHNNILLLVDNEENVSIQPLPDASVSHNISIVNYFGSANNNKEFVNENALFLGEEGNSTDGQYMLSENSPAKGAGTNGTDIGPFGGPDPYRLSGLPSLPNIYELSTGGFVSGDNLSVHIKIKQ